MTRKLKCETKWYYSVDGSICVATVKDADTDEILATEVIILTGLTQQEASIYRPTILREIEDIACEIAKEKAARKP